MDVSTLSFSQKGITFLKAWENGKLDLNLHNDSEGYCTIGYGHLIEKAKCEDGMSTFVETN
ncbi:lysozyme family protein [Tenacibaculum maritimum]|uniref:hypothetical protein n=1 Tax=Tenacibaculum maritimum TaxID=107401 RepID=UPI00132F758B|nr:hypothetical protein [Tenacibaculum maritimum]